MLSRGGWSSGIQVSQLLGSPLSPDKDLECGPGEAQGKLCQSLFRGRAPGAWEMRISSSIGSMHREMDGKGRPGDPGTMELFGLEKTSGDHLEQVTQEHAQVGAAVLLPAFPSSF